MMLESPEVIGKRIKKKLATRVLKSCYDSELTAMAKSGKDRSKSLESKTSKSKVTVKSKSKSQAPKIRTAQAPPKLPEPEDPKIIFSKPEPEEFPEIEDKPEGVLGKMLKKVSDALLKDIFEPIIPRNINV